MFIGILVFLIALTIILFPIPLKITLKYSRKILEIYIYNKKLKAKTHKKKSSIIKPEIKQKKSFFKSFTFSDIRLIINVIMNLKFKPTLNLTTKLEYGFDDAAVVAILFGLIHSTYSYLYLLLQNFVKVKNIDHKVIPYFEEKNLSIEICSIIYTNLAKIIYMSLAMLICLANIKIRHKKLI